MNISVQICFTLATGRAYALYIYRNKRSHAEVVCASTIVDFHGLWNQVVYAYMYVYIHMYACTYMYMYVCIYMYMRICMDVYICVCVCVCVCVYIYMYMYVCICICISLYRMYVQFVSFSIGE